MTHATPSSSVPLAPRVQRDLTLFDAVMMGLTATIGAGVFIGIGIGAGIAGPAVLFAIVIAALVALCNSLSSAQLMAHQTNKRGAFQHSHRFLQPYLDFFLGWTFLFAKAAAAATVTLTLSGYLLNAIDHNDIVWRIGIGLVVLVLLTITLLGDIRFTPWSTTVAALIVIGSLLYFCVAGYPGLLERGAQNLLPFFIPPSFGTSPIRSIFHASALMFLAYAGVERIATLQTELREPQRTVPRAIIIALLFVMALYTAVAIVAIGASGDEALATATTGAFAPLAIVAKGFAGSRALLLVTAGAIVALLGVLYHLILGLSRTMLFMGRRKQLPNMVAKLDKAGKTPERAILASAGLIALMVLIGDIRTTWSFSAFAALVYYSLANLVALQVPSEGRTVPRIVPMVGLLCSLFLAFWVRPVIWTTGLLIIFIGFGWRWLMHRL